jgi:hypothetical protein
LFFQVGKQQALLFLRLDLVLGLDASIAANMQYVDPSAADHARYQQVPMANGRVLFAAHEGDAVLGHAALEPLDASQKRRRLGHSVIQCVARFVQKSLPIGPAAKLLTHEQVANPSRFHAPLQVAFVELRVVTRERLRPHVDQYLDPMLVEQLQQLLFAMI